MDADTKTFAERFDRFVRWFVTASPTAVVDLPLPPPSTSARRAAESRRPAALVRAHHAGPVRVSVEGKS